MLKYIVEKDNVNGNFVIRGDFNPNARPIKIPDKDPDVNKFMDYFLYKYDVDEACNYLQCISYDKHIIINKALFIAGLNAAMKGFKKSNGRTGIKNLNKNEIIDKYPNIKDDIEYFECLRDKHFVHDENSMTQTTAFLLLNPRGECKIFGGPPSVVFNIAALDYYAESQKLLGMLKFVDKYIVNQIDDIGDKIYYRYCKMDYETLSDYGVPSIRLASTADINQNRK